MLLKSERFSCMFTHVEKSRKLQTRAVTQKKNTENYGHELVDNRAETIKQRQSQEVASQGQSSSVRTAVVARLFDNQVVQRLKGAKGTAQEDKPVPYTLNQEFITKHVANNIGEAVSVTEARIDTGGPPGIVAGTAPNNLAKRADWESAIDNSDALVPPAGEWSGEDYGDTSDNWEERLVKVEVNGWEAIGTKGNVTAKVANNKKYLGGKWSVTNCKFDEKSDSYIDATGNVSVDISHLTS